MKKKSLLITLTLIISLFVSGLTVQAESLSDPVNVPDKNLKKLINITLQKEEDSALTQADMAKLKSLNSNDIPLITQNVDRPTHGIKSLKGLEFATNLEKIDVSNNNIDDLTSLSKLKKLTEVDVSYNAITDFRPIQPLLEDFYIKNLGQGDIPVFTIGQILPKEPIVLNVPSDGGKFEIQLPEIYGYENIDKFLSEYYELPTIENAIIPDLDYIDGVSIQYNKDTNIATLDFTSNIVGDTRDINIEIQQKYEATTFSLKQPVHVVQEPKFSCHFSLEDDEQILNMSTKDFVSTPYVEATISSNGNPVKLQDVKIDFPKTKPFNQNVFEAKDLKIDKNKFKFNIAKKADAKEPACGNYKLSPIIKFQVEGDDTWYSVPKEQKFYNIYISNTTPLEFADEVVFDLSKDSEVEGTFAGCYRSEKFDLNIPGDRTIRRVIVYNNLDERLYDTNSDSEWRKGDRKSIETAISPEKMDDEYYRITVVPIDQSKAETAIEFKVKAKYVYSKKDSALEEKFTSNIASNINVGESKDISLSYNGMPCTGYDITSSNNKLLSAKGHTLKGVSEGKANIEINGIRFTHTINDIAIKNVEYLNPVTKDITVKAVKSPVNADKNNDSNSPLTGDNADIIFYVTLGVLALGSVIYLISKKKIRN